MRKRLVRYGLITLSILFVGVNILAFNHARSFTTFSDVPEKDVDVDEMTFPEQVKVLFTGVKNPRPTQLVYPNGVYEHVTIESNEKLACWYFSVPDSKGTVIMFHGYKANKSQLLERASIIRAAGYNALLVDMMGAGGSTGSEVTIGYKEAVNVLDCYRYVEKRGEKNIYLFGISMGAAAIMKAVSDYDIHPAAIITEAPFARMSDAVRIRFNSIGLPYFPLGPMLVFWGGVQHGFWAFNHNPCDYARKIECPTLIIYGAKDKRVGRQEIDDIDHNLKAEHKVLVFPDAGHVNFMEQYKDEWTQAVVGFINRG